MKVKTQSKKVNKAWLNQHVNDLTSSWRRKRLPRRAAYKLKEIGRNVPPHPPRAVRGGLGLLTRWPEPVPAPPHGPQRGRHRRVARHADRVGLVAHNRSTVCSSFRAIFAKRRCWRSSKTRCGCFTGSYRTVDFGGVGHGPQFVGGGLGDAALMSIWWSWRWTLPASMCDATARWWSNCSTVGLTRSLVKLFKDTFRVVKPIKPKSSRDKSSETFLVGLGLK